VLLLYGVGETLGYAFGSIVWAAQMASILIGGTISLILLAILNKEKALKD
jgi:predicted membrane protein